jgi:indolepyruvate ferredoxin oxidoreductase
MERDLIAQYEADMSEINAKIAPYNIGIAVELARLPLDVRGFGPVKEANAQKAEKRREELKTAFLAAGPEGQIAA